MKEYKTGDRVRVSDREDCSYEDADSRTFAYQRNGYFYCVDDQYDVEFNDDLTEVMLVRWQYIVKKPPEYVLTGEELSLVYKYMKTGSSVKEHNKISALRGNIAEAIGL